MKARAEHRVPLSDPAAHAMPEPRRASLAHGGLDG